MGTCFPVMLFVTLYRMVPVMWFYCVEVLGAISSLFTRAKLTGVNFDSSFISSR